MNRFTNSKLYSKAFGPRKNDNEAEARRRLAECLDRMRENVSQLLTLVPADCKDLTVHDVTHLDALWEMADLVGGPQFPLNPAETFVLGGAILLHDAGLTTAAFPGGLEEIRRTEAWSEITGAMLREAGLDPSEQLIAEPPAELVPSIKFAVLRELHAEQAERMATQSWQGTGFHYLIQDTELRDAFGASIGRIAFSHHWELDRLAEDLSKNIGSSIALAAEWGVDERRIACLLRCADAAHIDRRRAPSMLFAALKPAGLSHVHWVAQNRINKPVRDGSSLVYSSGSAYRSHEIDAWWVAFDLVKLADKEIRTCNALLEDMGLDAFAVQRVNGADSPRILAKFLRTEGWTPIDAEVKVSDPVQLARRLGGRHLYGFNPIVPLRELLQNAADTIHARREMEGRADNWGRIDVTIEESPDDLSGCWLHVDDSGVGMTEAALSGPLLDFGKSIWNSPLLRAEMPGLQSKKVKPIGKFGIGFFSVFEIADEVKVVTRHIRKGANDTLALEFRSLSMRPVIRSAQPAELPRDFSTRVSLRIKDKSVVTDAMTQPEVGFFLRSRGEPYAKRVQRLIAMLDIEVNFSCQITKVAWKHAADVYAQQAGIFLGEVYATASAEEIALLTAMCGNTLRELKANDGTRVGRAALLLSEKEGAYRESEQRGEVSVGGFIYEESGKDFYVGCVDGFTDMASRARASASLSKETWSEWASEQAQLINREGFPTSYLMRFCACVAGLGGNPGDLPYAYSAGKLITLRETDELIARNNVLLIPLVHEYGSEFQAGSYTNMRFHEVDPFEYQNVVYVAEASRSLLDGELVRDLVKAGAEASRRRPSSYLTHCDTFSSASRFCGERCRPLR